ncbi:MAG: hypothetical protein ACYTHJ_01270 [Planctomycetota bacterium]|jgi:hypothetical protein
MRRVTIMAMSAFVLLGLYGERADATPPASLNRHVADLADPSFAKRTAATIALCKAGAAARPALLAVASSEDAELAFRARYLLNLLDELYFTGTEIELTLSRSSVEWNESVDLLLVVHNRTDHPARIPFTPEGAKGSGDAGVDAGHGHQVGRMLDLADWLSVRHADGRVVELKVDNILDDDDVSLAVQSRLNGGSESMVLPHSSVKFRVPQFNRGWARFPFLDKGEYKVIFEYVPVWHEAELDRERVGRVASEPAVIKITEAAPRQVSRGGAQAAIEIEDVDDRIVAFVRNQSDLGTIVNRNIGPVAPFASASWAVESDPRDPFEIKVGTSTNKKLDDFVPSSLVELAAGQRLELAALSKADLFRAVDGRSPGNESCTLRFSYGSVVDRQWQKLRGDQWIDNPDAPEILRSTLPFRMLSIRLTGSPLVVAR